MGRSRRRTYSSSPAKSGLTDNSSPIADSCSLPAYLMKILFLADNFPPEKNAQASRVYERACYWAKWGHDVTVLTCFPNFPEGKLYPGYRNRLRQIEYVDGIR